VISAPHGHHGAPLSPGAALPYGGTTTPYGGTTTPYGGTTTPYGGSAIPGAVSPGTVVPGGTIVPGTTVPPGATIVPGTTFPPGATIVPGTTVPPGGTIVPGTPAPGAEPIKKMPKDVPAGKSVSTTPSTPMIAPAGAKVETEAKNPFELDRRYEKRVSRATDYSHLTGQLSYVHADGGLWVLRYAPLAEEDRYGGSVVLARDSMMNSYREGDLVSVEGQVISQRGSSRLGGPLYRVQTISLVDRPQ